MTFIIGDIHGEISKLQKLMAQIEGLGPHPKLIFIGDYIDKGEDSQSTLDYLSQLSRTRECIFLMGNHEYCWQRLNHENYENYLLTYGGRCTMQSFGLKSIQATREQILGKYNDLFSSLQVYTIWKNYFICHSGLPPRYFETPPEEIPLNEFLFNRYDFIKYQNLYLNSFKVIFGHTGFYSVYTDGFKIGIDTAACFVENQPLSAFCIDNDYVLNSDGIYYSVNEISSSSCPNIVRVKPWRSAL